MKHIDWKLMGPPLSLALCAAITAAALIFTGTRAIDPAPRGQDRTEVVAADLPRYGDVVSLPGPVPIAGAPDVVPPPHVTPQEQAAAGNRVIAGSLVRALADAAARGNTRAVEDILRGLERYGDVARHSIQEELGREKNSKAVEALLKALERLRS